MKKEQELKDKIAEILPKECNEWYVDQLYSLFTSERDSTIEERDKEIVKKLDIQMGGISPDSPFGTFMQSLFPHLKKKLADLKSDRRSLEGKGQ